MLSYPAVTLLVVDDDPGVAELIRMTAVDVGFRVAVADVAGDFLDFGEKRPDVIVLDLQMPGLDGVEVIRQLAASATGATVFLVSGLGSRMLASAAELSAAHGLRCLGSMSKPFSYEDLFEALLGVKQVLALDRPKFLPKFREIDPAELEVAIRAGQIHPYYQPIMCLDSGRVVAVEALARWQHPVLGMLQPATFIPLAERSGLVGSLNWAVLSAAMQDMKPVFEQFGVTLSVNFTAGDFADLKLPERVLAALNAAKLPPAFLNIELTEDAVIEDLPKALDSMMRLRMKGVGLWLDDFGTGYSGFDQIRRLPASALKLDRSFMPTDEHWEEQVILFRGLVDLAGKLGLPCIAEGVETPRQLELMRELGCSRGQGFYFGRPMPAKEFAGWMALHSSYAMAGVAA